MSASSPSPTPPDAPDPTPGPTPGPTLVSAFAGDPDMLDLVELFVAEMPQRVEKLTEAYARGDLGRLAMLAHQLKGAGGGYGFPSITDAARDLEHAARDPQAALDALRHEVDGLVNLCQRASAA